MNSDYLRIAKAIEFINSNINRQPSLAEVAAHLNLSQWHFQRVFSRWVGLSPKKYLQLLTVERAKLLLAESQSIMQASDNLGMSSSSRLYDHFVQLEAVTPGEFKQRGAGINIDYGIADSPFGDIFVAATGRGICKLSFMDAPDLSQQVADLRRLWPDAKLIHQRPPQLSLISEIFARRTTISEPLSLHVCGTNFQIKVWRALLKINLGCLSSYSQLAKDIGTAKAARAVGTAVSANPVAFFIPCHRVIRHNGEIGGYRWGVTRKHAILRAETL